VKNLKFDSFAKLSQPNLVLVVFIVFNLLVGILTFRDYGISFDEPGIYSFARESVNAYGKFLQPVEYSDPRANFDLRYYGPFYFIAVDLISQGLSAIGLQIPVPDIWHLVYFLTFQSGLVIFYLLSRRWLTEWAALGATVLLGSQPLLWGHAFINPKDIPFMVFFLFSIYAGFKMVDRLTLLDSLPSLPGDRFFDWLHASQLAWNVLAAPYKRKAQRQAGAMLGLALLLAAGTPAWQNLLSGIVRRTWADVSPLLVRIGAISGTTIPLENYIHKVSIWFTMLEVMFILLLIFLACWLFLRQIPQAVQTLKRFMGCLFRPLFSAICNPTIVCAGIVLGFSTSIRLLGLLAGGLVVLFLFYRLRFRAWLPVIIYGCLAILSMYATWPFLWGHPVQRFMDSLVMMSGFPIKTDILFGGQYYPVDHLPQRYLPVLMSIQFTEPAVCLFLIGGIVILWQYKRLIKIDLLLVLFAWLLLPLALIILGHRTIYDNFRHLLFLIPPLFLLAGIAIDALFRAVRASILRLLVIVLLGLSGWMAMFQLHPYEYVYYNGFAGGLGSAATHYPLDYWVTSFRADARYLNLVAPRQARVLVCGPANVLRYDLRPDLTISEDCSGLQAASARYDYVVTHDRYGGPVLYPDAPVLYKAEKQDITFSEVRSFAALPPAQKP
jgi:hypothetical protein